MAYQVQTFDYLSGRPIGYLGSFGNIPSARQAIVDDAKLDDLPDCGPDYGVLDHGVVEGWIIDRTEYTIVAQR